MKKGDLVKSAKNLVNPRTLRVVGEPRYIPGGYVVGVTWETTADIEPEGCLPDGTFHPAHVPGFTWFVPVESLVSA